MQNQDFDSVFKTKLETFEMPPDDASWDAIGQQLNKKRWLTKTAYASALALLIGVLSYFLSKEKETIKTQPVDTTTIEQIPSQPSSTEVKSTISSEEPTSNTQGLSTTKVAKPTTNTKTQELTPATQPTSNIISKTDSVATPITTTPKTDTVSAPKVVVVKKKKPVYVYQQDTIVKTDTVQVKKRVK